METQLTMSPIRQKSKPGRPPSKKVEAEVDETPAEVSDINLGFVPDPTKSYTFEVLVKSPVARPENLGARAKVFDTGEKRYREIGYHALAPSIFTEEWDESLLEAPQPPLYFNRNTIDVPGQDIRLMEYMMCHSLYEHSPYRVMNRPAMFTLADKEVIEAIKAEKHAKEKKALDAISETDLSDIKPIARVIFGITETSDTAIVNAMNELVKSGKKFNGKVAAELVLDNINNPKLNRQYNIQKAIDNGVIKVDNNKGAAFMSEGDGIICRIETKNALKELVDYSFTDEGKKFYQILRNKI
jgi:hypothetical protein